MAHSSVAQEAVLAAEAQRNLFASASTFEAATGIAGENGVAGCFETKIHWSVKAVISDEHKLNRPAFAEGSVDHQSDVIFSDNSTFSSANDGPVLVYGP